MALPKALARRLDRLARGAHAFHRYAHHPLCDEYRTEVVQIGRRTRVCRGCAFVAIGTASGLVLGAFATHWAGALLLVAVAALAVSRVEVGGRPAKWRARLLPAAALGAAAASGVASVSAFGFLVAVIAAALYASVAVAYRRRGPDRGPCQSCPERAMKTPCRGLRAIVRRERAFQRMAGRMIEKAGL